MENLDVNELGMVDVTNYQLAVKLLANIDQDDSYLSNYEIVDKGRNYNCNDCGK